MFDFKLLLLDKDRGIRPAHQQAIENIFNRCKADDPVTWTCEFVKAAVDILRPAKIPLSPSMAQGFLESGFGKSLKSLFGIKARMSDVLAGRAIESKTKEYINGKWIETSAYFFKDKSMRAEFEHYLDLMRRVHPAFAKFYPARAEDYMNYILEPNKAYATDPNYKKMILNLVDELGLRIFDQFEMYYGET